MPSSRPTFTTIRTEGGLLPADLLQRLAANDREVPGLTPESYHLSGEKLSEAINRAWNRLQGAWAAFAAAREKDTTEHGAGITRERWLLPLFQELGFGRLLAAKPIALGDKTYPISHLCISGRKCLCIWWVTRWIWISARPARWARRKPARIV